MLNRRLLLAALAVAFPAALMGSAPAFAADTMIIELKDGPVTVELRPDLAPKHVEQIKALVAKGAYDGVVFHRVIEGFMAQTGDVQFGNADKGTYDVNAAGTGGSDLPDIPAEFTDKAGFERGTVGMARSSNPDSANSQFFIMFAPGGFLDGQYTIIGNVVDGMDRVDAIKRGDEAQNGTVTDPDRMIKVTLGTN
jgi:cyclophilin family peptidyl-prolyl cis-trans isomerase